MDTGIKLYYDSRIIQLLSTILKFKSEELDIGAEFPFIHWTGSQTELGNIYMILLDD